MCSGLQSPRSSSGGPATRPASASERQPIADCVADVSNPAKVSSAVTSQIISTSAFYHVDPGEKPLPPSDSAELISGVARALVLAIESPKHPAADSVSVKAAPGIFDSSVVPNISVERYLQRLKAVFDCSDAVFVLALIMIDRLLEKESIEPQRITMQNVHRLYLASLIVTVKYNEDLVYGNSHYARAGGIQLREVNRLERFFLRALDYDFHVQPEQYHLYERALRVLRSQSSSTAVPQAPTASALCGLPVRPVDGHVQQPAAKKGGTRHDTKDGYEVAAKAPPVAGLAAAPLVSHA